MIAGGVLLYYNQHKGKNIHAYFSFGVYYLNQPRFRLT